MPGHEAWIDRRLLASAQLRVALQPLCQCVSVIVLGTIQPRERKHASPSCSGGWPPSWCPPSCRCRCSGTSYDEAAGELLACSRIHARSQDILSMWHLLKHAQSVHTHAWTHACGAQELVGLPGPRSETCSGLQSLQQWFSTSTPHAAKGAHGNDEAQPAHGSSSAQAPAGQQQSQHAAADSAETANDAAAPQEPPTIEGLQAELDTQREASEGHAAEVCTCAVVEVDAAVLMHCVTTPASCSTQCRCFL
jgi:hypothetical protein